MSERAKTLRIDPRDFIGGPYQSCPKCGQQEFGVLHIEDSSYTRRCRSCWHMLRYGLPKLKKRVIYLDQFVFSNIMKTLSAGTPGHERAKSEPLWREIFECLDVLCRMQLVICPDSHEHHDESLISPFYEELKHTYEHFSTGISFERCISIQHRQIMLAFSSYLENKKPDFELDPTTVTCGGGRLHGWNDRMFVTVSGTLPGEKQRLQRSRSALHASLEGVFKEWQTGGENFAQAFEREKNAYGKSILNAYAADMQKRINVMKGLLPPTIDNMLGSVTGSLVSSLEYSAKMRGLSREKAVWAIKEFFASGAVNEIPANIVSAAMWASLAMKAAAGQKQPPDAGMATDIEIVSTLLPYCEVMFVDNKCRSLLSDVPKKHQFPYQCLVFSSKTSDSFLHYLREIRNSVTPEHLALLQEVYGPKVLEPPKTIYGVGARKRNDAC